MNHQRTLDMHTTIAVVAQAEAIAARHGLSTGAAIHGLTLDELKQMRAFYDGHIDTFEASETCAAFVCCSIVVSGVPVKLFAVVLA